MAERLAELVEDLVPTSVIKPGIDGLSAEELLAHARASDADGHRTVVICDAEGSSTAAATRAADRVLVLVQGSTAPPPACADGFAGCEIVAIGEVPSARHGAFRTYRLASADETDGLGRIARRLAGRSVGIVLSGGGARTMAHIGVLAGLEDAGVVIDRVGACSMACLAGGLYAAGHRPAEIGELVRRFDLPSVWMQHAATGTGAQALGGLVAGQCERLVRDFYSVSVDLLSGRQRVHRDEPLAHMVEASVALPGLTKPARASGRLLIDGALVDTMPVEAMYGERDGPILAVDVSGRSARVEKWMTRWGEDELPAPIDVTLQALDLASVERHARARRLADLVFEPDVPFGALAWHRVDEIVAAGRRCADETLAQLTSTQRMALGL